MASELEMEVGKRIKAIMEAFGIPSYPKMGEICGTTKSNVGNWRSGYALPRVPQMIQLCERTGVTLDWIYRGSVHNMDTKLDFPQIRRRDIESPRIASAS
jgi:transcriptional regulator with XRE-family HTH domain